MRRWVVVAHYAGNPSCGIDPDSTALFQTVGRYWARRWVRKLNREETNPAVSHEAVRYSAWREEHPRRS